MKDTNIFQLVVLGIFIALAIVGVVFFAGFGGFGSSEGQVGAVTIWGTLERERVNDVLGFLQENHDDVDLDRVQYVQQDARTYETTLINAIAAGRGPDLFFLNDEHLVNMEDKLQPLPFDSFSQRRFQETFIEGAEIFLRADGILALPFSVDPMVLYWNRTLFSNAGVAQPPKQWNEIFPLVDRLTIRDNAGNVTQSTLGFGEFTNVTHAKEILVTLTRQAGSPLIRRQADGSFDVTLGSTLNGENALEAALRFFTEFSDPAKSTYTWNSALPVSRSVFLAGNLALYPGFASELPGLRQANPNLNFALTPLPQAASSERVTMGDFIGLAVPNGAVNPGGGFRVALLMTGADAISRYTSRVGLPPVRRDLIADQPADAIDSVLYESALIAHTWLDPNPEETSAILRSAVRDITSGRSRIGDVADIIGRQLRQLFTQ